MRCRAPAAARSYRHPPAASTAAPVTTITYQRMATAQHNLLPPSRHRLPAAPPPLTPPRRAPLAWLPAAQRRSTPLNAAQRVRACADLHATRTTMHGAASLTTVRRLHHTRAASSTAAKEYGRRHGRSTSARRPRDEQRPTSARPRDEQRSTSRLSCRVNDLRVGGDGSTVMSASAVVSGSERQRAAALLASRLHSLYCAHAPSECLIWSRTIFCSRRGARRLLL